MEKRGKEGGVLFDALLATVSSQQLLKVVLQKLRQEHHLELPELIKTFQEVKEEVLLPLSIFSHSLEPAEALYKFLKENEHFSYQKIADQIKRDRKSVWATYQRARERRKQKFVIKEDQYLLPLSLFTNRSYSFLESTIFYLNSIHHLSNQEIAVLLQRSQNTIAVLLKRARDKQRKHEQI